MKKWQVIVLLVTMLLFASASVVFAQPGPTPVPEPIIIQEECWSFIARLMTDDWASTDPPAYFIDRYLVLNIAKGWWSAVGYMRPREPGVVRLFESDEINFPRNYDYDIASDYEPVVCYY